MAGASGGGRGGGGGGGGVEAAAAVVEGAARIQIAGAVLVAPARWRTPVPQFQDARRVAPRALVRLLPL